MTTLPRDHDTWRLSAPECPEPPGEAPGDECGRYPEIDEDAPRNWRPRPCGGTMKADAGEVVCDTCGELA